MSSQFGFTRRELRTLRALRTPLGVQRALDAMPYHLADTAWSPRRALRPRTAPRLGGAILAAAAPPVLDVPTPLAHLPGRARLDPPLLAVKSRGDRRRLP